ncbi:MAG: BMC domain-containing protein [Paenibacillaceae bacterium]
MESYKQALGMIETRGLTALIAAADEAAKAAQVEVLPYQSADAGIVTIFLTGDVASVSAAVEAGAKAAERVGVLLRSRVIANPVNGTMAMILHKSKSKTVVPSVAVSPIVTVADWLVRLKALSIHELRRQARVLVNFPLTGREIVRTSKQDLIQVMLPILQKEGEQPL